MSAQTTTVTAYRVVWGVDQLGYVYCRTCLDKGYGGSKCEVCEADPAETIELALASFKPHSNALLPDYPAADDCEVCHQRVNRPDAVDTVKCRAVVEYPRCRIF